MGINAAIYTRAHKTQPDAFLPPVVIRYNSYRTKELHTLGRHLPNLPSRAIFGLMGNEFS